MGIQINGQTDTVTATDGSINVGGDVTIPGVLTYEDVTNIDAVGVITARSDVSIADKIIHTGDTNTAIRFPGNDTFTVETSGSEAIRVDSSRRLLVGTTSGSYTTEIVNETEANLAIRTYNNGAQNFAGIRLFKARGTEASPNVVSDDDTLNEINIYGYDGANFKPAARIAAFVDGTPGSNDMPGRLTFSTTPDGSTTPTERLRITSTGKIGVGGAPAAWHSAASSNVIQVGSSVLFDYSSAQFDVGHNYYYDGSNYRFTTTGYASRITQHKNDGSIRFWSLGTGNAAAAATVSERLRITSDGKFAIGDSSPEGMLTIKATAAEPPTSGTTANSAIQLYSSLSNHMNFGLNTVNGGYGGYIQVSDNNHAVNYQLNLNPNGGKVIVGSNVAQAHANMDDLQVGNGSGNRGITISSGTSNYGTVAFGDSADGSGTDRYEGFIEYYHDDNSMRLGTVHSERLRILNDGTITTGGLSSTPGTVAAGSFVQAAANAGFFSNGIDGKFGTASNHPLYLQVNGVTKATVTAGGAFSVGTTSPQQPNVPSMHLHSTANDDARIAITTPSKPNSRIGYFGLSNKFGMDVHNGFEVRDASASYATRFAINSTGVVTFGGQSYATATKSGGVNVSNSVYFDITGSSYVFVKIMIKVGYSGNASYHMHAQYDYVTCNYYTTGGTATRTDILQVEAANAQFNYSDISISRPSNRTVRVTYAPSSGAGTHHPILYVSGVFDSITVS